MGRCAIRRGPGAVAASAWPLQHSSAECRPRLYWEERARRCPSVVCFAFRVCPVQTRFLLAHRPSPPRRRARICHPVAQRDILPPLLHYLLVEHTARLQHSRSLMAAAGWPISHALSRHSGPVRCGRPLRSAASTTRAPSWTIARRCGPAELRHMRQASRVSHCAGLKRRSVSLLCVTAQA